MGAGVLVLKRKKVGNGEYRNKLPKTPKQMERHLKGIANHNRIAIILMLANNSNLSVENIAEALGGNYPNISIHLFRLVNAGLINKKHKGRNVVHELTPYGKIFVSFLTTFKHSS
ncbi:MAG TPA: winged helix-turn-helix domain-containing protein [Candidatus Paceibacterota bacterium]